MALNGTTFGNSRYWNGQDTLKLSLTGLVKASSGALSAITDNSANWDAGYTFRLTSASGTAPLTLSLASNGLTGSVSQANGSTNGFLSSTDWTTFNAKLAAADSANNIRKNIIDAAGDLVVGTANNSYARLALGSDRKYIRSDGSTLLWDTIANAAAASRGLLTSTDWNTFNNKLTSSLASGKVFVGNGSNIANSVSLSGDATLDNAGALTLVSSGVTAAQYGITTGKIPVVTIDAKGRITAASDRDIATADIPNLDWSKITTGKPTTLSGYGISDALNLAGGTLTGKLNTIASSTSAAGLKLPPGEAPASPSNGDIWTTAAGVYARIDGSNVGPFGIGNGTITSVTGTTNRITSTGGTTSVIDIAETYTGQTSITTLGTINTGTWNATVIADGKIATALSGKSYNGLTPTALTTGFTIAGGTTAKTLTVPLDASVSGTNTGDQTTITGNAGSATTTAISNDVATATSVFPTWVGSTSGNLAQTVSSTKLSFIPSTGILTATGFSGSGAGLANIPNAALTNSNVTIGTTAISLGGSSTTLAGLTSVTSTSFSGALTGNASTSTTATNLASGGAGQIPYQSGSGSTSMLAAGTSGQVLTSGGTGTPSWTTPTTGTVTSVSVSPANGVSGSVATSSTTPAITLTLGAITPSSVSASGAISGTTGSFSGNISGNANATSTISNFSASLVDKTANYTLALGDNGKILTFNSATDLTLTVPSLAAGFNCMVVQTGAGKVTFSASGTTISNRSSYTKTAGQYAIATIVALTSSTYVTSGDMQ